MSNLAENGIANQFEIAEMNRLADRVCVLANERGLNRKNFSADYFRQWVYSDYSAHSLWKLHSDREFEAVIESILNDIPF